MRIAFDLSPAIHRHAGIGRYAHGLLAALVALDDADRYTAFYYRPRGTEKPQPPLDRLPARTLHTTARPWRLSVLLAYLTHIPQDRLLPDTDLFHATDHLLPYFSRLRSVFTLHDLSFRLYPQMHGSWNRRFLSLMLPHFLRRADAIIAVSDCTRRDIERLRGIPPEKIAVIYEGVSPAYRPVDEPARLAQIRTQYRLPEHFILSVGTIEPRKNLVTLLEASSHITHRVSPITLVIAGKKGWLYEDFFRRLRELGLEDRVLLLGFVPDEDLPALYSAADLFVFPSLYEGFGLPVLEAMACGTPVVASNASSLPEVVGEAGLLVDPHDVGGLAAAMERMLADEHLRAEMRARGLERAETFTWEKTARETLRVYEEVLRK